MICANCKYFDQSDVVGYEHLGWCELKLPSWVAVILDANSRTVRIDDTCSFGEEKK